MHDFVPLNDESSWGFGKFPDFNALLSPHPAACFCMRYAGHSLKEEGIFKGDILVIDCCLEPKPGDLAVVNTMLGEFCCSRLEKPLCEGGPLRYRAPRLGLRDVEELFGVVKHVIRLYTGNIKTPVRR